MSKGRPTKYNQLFNELAYNYTLLGATDQKLAEFLNVTETTINNWKQNYPSFFESIKKGKEKADAKVAESLYKEGDWFSIRRNQRRIRKRNFSENHKNKKNSCP